MKFVPVNLNYATNFQSTGGDNGTIEILQNSTLSGTFSAAAGTRVASLVVTENNSLVLDTNLNLSDTVTLQSNTTITVNPGFGINATYVGFYSDAPSTMLFGHNTTLNAEVTRVNNINGEMRIYTAANIIEFQGASNILKEIDMRSGDLGSKVIFSSNNPAYRSFLTKNIFADIIETKGSTIGIDAEELGLFGNTSANNTNFDLGLNTLCFSRSSAFMDTSAVVTGATKFNTTFNGTKGGHLVAEGLYLNMSGAETVTINLTDTSPIPGPAGRQYIIFAELRDKANKGGVIIPGTVTIS